LGYSYYQGFSGRYIAQISNSGIRLSVSDGIFTLSGCNTFNFKFSLADNGNIIFGAVSSTKVACENDFDNVFLYTILRAQRIFVKGSSLRFINGRGE
jgi:heat shock protein HslJ